MNQAGKGFGNSIKIGPYGWSRSGSTSRSEPKVGHALTVVEWKDCHFLAVATISDLQNSYCNQWTHPYEPQISSRFVFSAVCLHFTAN